ncbi:type I-E CRISPR-associated protein Cas7/Cse4/CasC [Paraliomyxa miuraensis]|uniref:type I-E CRISPR-associated protein Cas7/Cse4/CasC n=1 Tax=Paraliomyxa miuraensis TaxID=376150 RepID=UPI00224DC306|nr:type I-E CRISPR-associated protein Cas7/Cse4/CasC [Paraliomyxa miuraensis]MCX4244417.1 type I-E CRISPR-associated protein Cas7/Cse4/CasC [Paraliomyxa miuraensis]
MTDQPFLQIHTLTSYPASLLNRDDVGFAKRIPFGGATRVRVSSQCLKRHWRRAEGPHALSSIDLGEGPVAMSVRSRVTFQQFVRDRMVAEGIEQPLAVAATEEVMKLVLGESAKAKEKKKSKGADAEEADDSCKTSQITVLGRPEVDFLLAEALAIATAAKEADGKDLVKKVQAAAKSHFDRERQKNLKGLRMGAGLDAALFGRMVTSDMLARTDAAIHVAHAFTVHEEMTESDFFSAVDDLERERDDSAMGSGHIGSAELTTGLYYGYVAVDLPLLISNLEGGVDRKDWTKHRGPLAAEVIRRIIRLIATVSPGAKLGSTAPHSYAQLVLVERGAEQPRSLANAFLKPVRPDREGDIVKGTYVALAKHLEDLDQMFGRGPERRFAGMGPVEALGPALGQEHRGNLAEVADWAASAAAEG